MGLFWKHVKKDAPEEGLFVRFEGDKEAVSKQWPLWWRLQNNRHSLAVADIDYKKGYRIYFKAGDVTMCYRLLLNTEFVLVRVGPEPVTFWVEDQDGNVGVLMKTNGMRPGIGRRRNPSGEHSLSFQHIGDQVSVV